MAVVAIILSSLFTSGSCGSTELSRDSANASLDLEETEPQIQIMFIIYVS